MIYEWRTRLVKLNNDIYIRYIYHIVQMIYSGVRLIASRILDEICLLIGEPLEQLLLGEHYCYEWYTRLLKFNNDIYST